jgi:eukaryotic-like serine/threonine-protein kinase
VKRLLKMVGLGPKNPRAFGDFELVAPLGKGAMAEVYAAVRRKGPKAGERVAIKRITPELASHPQVLEMFKSEAKLSMAMNHSNVVRVFEVGRVKKIDFLVMELVDGNNLAWLLRRCRELKRKFPAGFAVHVTRKVLEALAHAHAVTAPDGRPLGLVHCDVNPANVFVARTGEIKLGDFGVARGLLKDRFGGPIAGKSHYLSPEVLEGKVTAQADLWAVAVTLYELLTLERPFGGATDPEVYQAIREGDFKTLKEHKLDVPATLEVVLHRALSHNPELRFAHAMQFADALKATGLGEEQNQVVIKAVLKTLLGLNTLSGHAPG